MPCDHCGCDKQIERPCIFCGYMGAAGSYSVFAFRGKTTLAEEAVQAAREVALSIDAHQHEGKLSIH